MTWRSPLGFGERELVLSLAELIIGFRRASHIEPETVRGSLYGERSAVSSTKAGAIIRAAYSPYAVLRSVEDLLGFTPLAHAAHAASFAASVLPAAVR